MGNQINHSLNCIEFLRGAGGHRAKHSQAVCCCASKRPHLFLPAHKRDPVKPRNQFLFQTTTPSSSYFSPHVCSGGFAYPSVLEHHIHPRQSYSLNVTMSDRTTRSTRSSSRAPSRGAFQTSVLGQSSSTALVPNSNLAAQSKPIASLASPATTSTAVFTNARAFPPPTASRKRPLQTVTVSNQGASGSGSQNHSQGLERPKKKPQLEVIDLSSDSGGDDPVQIVGFHQPAKPGPVIQKQGGSQKRSGSLQDEVLMLRSVRVSDA
ncbi:hypothetical protein DL93DRAFT_97149 [Clavulina sp. PMI_390]|nr:hypothetical protein DL93DRAFT_97149 [Clavulina sp. PMI_390]